MNLLSRDLSRANQQNSMNHFICEDINSWRGCITNERLPKSLTKFVMKHRATDRQPFDQTEFNQTEEALTKYIPFPLLQLIN